MIDDPLMLSIDIVMRENTVMGKKIRSFINTNVPDVSALMEKVHSRIMASDGSKSVVYRTLNPTLALHSVYKDRHVVNDRFRMAFTRLRVSAHSLCVETGRWNRRGRGRLPLEERLCSCGEIQTETHVVELCPVTSNIRQNTGLSHIDELFNGKYTNEVSCKIAYDILKMYS